VALTENQVNDVFNTQLKRPATPYEVQTYQKASPQTLAGIKSTYGNYNPNSVSGYLQSQGLDPTKAPEIAKQYGINNYGTAEGNDALLKAIRTGSYTPTPGATPTASPSVPGSVQTAGQTNTQIPVQNPPQGQTAPQTGAPQPLKDYTGQPQSMPGATPTIPGSITGATTQPTPTDTTKTDTTASTESPATNAVNEALKSYQGYQSQVADIDRQIAEKRQIMQSAQKDKEKEIAQAGGLVNRAQIAQQVAAENAPIQQSINDLMATRSVYAQSQSQASTQLTQARADQKTEIQQSQFQQKQEQQAEQFSQKEQDVARKLDQSGWKSVSTTSYDEYGNVVGKGSVWKQNPADKIGVDVKGNVVSTSTDSKGNTVSTPVKTQADAPSKINLQTGQNIDISLPGYTTANVTFQGKDTQLTQSYIDQIAIGAIMNGGTIPAGSVRGTKGLPMLQTDAIKARMGQLDPGGNLALNKAQAQAWGKTMAKQIEYASTLNRALQSADADLQQVLKKYESSGVNDSSMPISNIIANASKYHLGNADVSAYKSSLSEISRLYSQVFSSTGRTTDATNKTAQDIIDGNISIDNLKQVAGQLQALGKIDVDKANDAVKASQDSMRGIVPGASRGNTPTKLSDKVKTALNSVTQDPKDPKTIYITKDIWSKLGTDKDAVIAEAEADGYKLLVK